jgi:D-lactate dehydrogenase
VDPANRFMRVESGVTNQAVQETALTHGFFWAPDPTSSAFCTVGGNLALNAAGPRAIKYGTTRENVLGLRAVTGAGDEINTGVYTTKGVVGYDLTRLIIGSEGTLAVITEATLKLIPHPQAKRTLQAVYSNVDGATTAVSSIMAQPVIPCALEFIDKASIDMIRDFSKAELPDEAGALLMIEVDGSESGIDAAVDAVSRAAQNEGLVQLKAARTEAEVTALWATRKALSPALRKIAPNKLNEDIVVPVSRIPDLITGLEGLSQEFGIPIVNFGHAGNGNIHVNLLYDSQDEIQAKKAQPCLSKVFDLVLATTLTERSTQ